MKNKKVPPSPIPPRGSSPRCTDYRPGLPPLPESSSQSPPSSSAAALPPVPAPSDAAISLPEIIRAYRPLVIATAGRYQGRGADFCDLEQEGYLALLILVPQCPDMNWLAYFLRCRL
ncbi:sigma factor, partial [Cloacibacillus sp.]